MRHPTISKIVSIITLLVVFVLTPLASHADMLGALRRLERDALLRESPKPRPASDFHRLKKPGKRMPDVAQQARRPKPQHRIGSASQRLRGKHPAFWSALKSAYHNRMPEIRKISHRQARQKQRGRSRSPKILGRILNRFVKRLQHLTVMPDTPTVQPAHEEQTVHAVAFSIPELPSFLGQQVISLLPTVPSLYTLASLRL